MFSLFNIWTLGHSWMSECWFSTEFVSGRENTQLSAYVSLTSFQAAEGVIWYESVFSLWRTRGRGSGVWWGGGAWDGQSHDGDCAAVAPTTCWKVKTSQLEWKNLRFQMPLVCSVCSLVSHRLRNVMALSGLTQIIRVQRAQFVRNSTPVDA